MCLSLAGESEAAGGDGCIDRDGGNEFIGVNLASWAVAAAADLSTETAAVGVLKSRWRVGGSGHWWSRAGESEAGGGGGSVDRDGGSGFVGLELASRAMAAAVDGPTWTAAVGELESCWPVGRRRRRWIRRQSRRQWVCLSLAGESADGGGG